MSNRKFMKQATVLIVRRGSDFLVSRIPYTLEYRWSTSPYDAWGCRKVKTAKEVARKMGGDLWLFNGITGELREARV